MNLTTRWAGKRALYRPLVLSSFLNDLMISPSFSGISEN